jgi:SAM-dependent methyltransferase
LAVERGIISKDDYQNFLECKTFIPGGCELGIYPCKWLLGILSHLEDLGRHFILKHKVRIASYDSYQVRCIGFLSERLGSFLLLKELNARFNNQIPATVFGHMTTIVPDEKSNYKPATTRFAKKIEKISYPLMWAHLVRKHGIRSVLDVGCGKGDSALNFKSLGCDIKSIDGSRDAQTTNLLGEDFVLADYAVAPSSIQTEFDLVWSCEFVEHVEERFMKNYLRDFRRGRFLAMTFAGPGQPGHHHVNYRPEEYWIRMMYSQGFDYLPEETAELREYARRDMEKNDSESDKRFVYHFMHRGLFFKNTGTCSGGL